MNGELHDIHENLAYILHNGLVEIRTLSCQAEDGEEGASTQRLRHIRDLADLLEFLPEFMLREIGDGEMELLLDTLADHCRKYPDSRYRYVEFFKSRDLGYWRGDFPLPTLANQG